MFIGVVYLLMLFIPNIIWTKNQPKDYENYVKNENRVLLILERAGEVLVCCFAIVVPRFTVSFNSTWSIWLYVSFAMMILYEIYWIRYFKSEKRMSDFYSSICGVPVAGATLPVCAFFLLGVYEKNIFLVVSTVILGIGHIGIHLELKYGLPHGRLYLAYYKGKLAGCIGLRKIDDENCEMKRLYVRPEFHSKHIASRLVQKIIEDAKEIGYANMLLDTLPFLENAIAMYKSYGFVEIESYNNSPMEGLIYMKLELK